MGSNDVDQAIQRLADSAGLLTIDQRLRIAALLAQPPEPMATTPQDSPASRLVSADWIVLTVEETAEVLKVGRTTVYDLIKAGQLSSIMIGRLRRIRHSDLAAYLRQAADDD